MEKNIENSAIEEMNKKEEKTLKAWNLSYAQD